MQLLNQSLVFIKLPFWVDDFNLGFKFFLATNENEMVKKKSWFCEE
jgi:hypothetical protein